MINIQDSSQFVNRHIGPNSTELTEMLATIGVDSLDQLIEQTVPRNIRLDKALDLPEALSEFEYLQQLKEIAAKNEIFRNHIGLGYYGTITPAPILRNIFQNPSWYTQYTPYQAEIAQGRLEALLNFQTMVSDLTGMPIANASLLDEGTAAAEAMAMFFNLKNKRKKTHVAKQFLVAKDILPQTLDVLITRAKPLGIEIIVADPPAFVYNPSTFGICLQYPGADGGIHDWEAVARKANEQGCYVVVAADILSLALLKPPGEWGADVVVGNTQRFGVPMGFGGPHAAYFATKETYKRQIPGRIIGISLDSQGNPALRMALQTREQHIRRDKATSNICTAQVLLAVIAGMYAVYHGPAGIRKIAQRTHGLTQLLGNTLESVGYKLSQEHYFDTVCIDVETKEIQDKIKELATANRINFHYPYKRFVQISLDETHALDTVLAILSIFAKVKGAEVTWTSDSLIAQAKSLDYKFPVALKRSSPYLEYEVFNTYHSESKLMRYIKRLENKDLSLVHSMIPLGSCTMKLNAATELIPVSWEEFSNLHPFAPKEQTLGYQQIFAELEAYLAEITGFAACSLQPNSGAQGEFTGLLVIRAYHQANGAIHRNVALIPSSAHGTNPASAVMVGMKVVVVKCDKQGNIDVADLKAKAEKYRAHLAALMITYPSTHGVFETSIKDICQIIHEQGGLVYMDGANMNAQVGLTSPSIIGADVCHLNLHKTFAIPHGGGGPGMGPICVDAKLAPFLPKHVYAKTGGKKGTHAVSAAPWGSASILLISYAYIRLLGRRGCLEATRYAILNANYIKARLESAYRVLYTGENGRAAHELIIDLRYLKKIGLVAEDVAKRLIDYGFHAPTLSFPVAETIMIEPTESEDKAELDRFCDALLAIREEIEEVITGQAEVKNNVLCNAPHTQKTITDDEWNYPYTRQKAAYPLAFVRERKFWASVGRVNNSYGDKHLVCTCAPVEAYADF